MDFVHLGYMVVTPLRPRLAPALFCRATCMDWIMDRAMLHHGITISGDHISDADYADDIAAVESDLTSISRTLENI